MRCCFFIDVLALEIFNIILISFNLCVDSFAVSITSGIVLKKVQVPVAIRVALPFSIPQTLMLTGGG